MLAQERFLGPQLLLSDVSVSGLFSNSAAQNPSGDASHPTTKGWKIKFDESGSNPVIADGVLYIGSADGAVYALDPETGKTKWRFQTGEDLSSATSGSLVMTVPRGTSVIDQMEAGRKAANGKGNRGLEEST
jgi:outer membrane protein assembly factor BamB